MTEEKRKIQKRKLDSVSDEEWSKALSTLSDYITWRLRGRTQYGAHSEIELGQKAVDFYMKEAYLKLAEYVWEWKEEHTLEEQLIRVASCLIQKKEDKYRRNVDSGYKINESGLFLHSEALIELGGLEPEEESILRLLNATWRSTKPRKNGLM